ncbi:MAG: sn-glycerol-3-phosphate ABC transporter ATP-binding protein UgpC [Rhodospirillales bacterium]|nr:sn-glycerol-3-phosphate ABC transporter ATP-binding protein UgpC [Rhodospirillales bacterium]
MADIEFRSLNKTFPDGNRTIRDLSLHVEDGEFMVVVGPSGCGKSTLLRMLAGLETVTSGEIRIGGKVVNDWPAQRRDIAMVFQDYALYPHMTVRDNLGFPLRMQGIGKADIARRVDDTAELLGLGQLLDRRPRQLSGGQRQRVAMGRAVVRQPGVFLMDEPLSNVDAKLRVQIRTEIAALQHRLNTTTIYVTHDQVEAMTLGDRVMVLRDGVVQQVASPAELYERPANAFVATFLGNPGMNIVAAALARDRATAHVCGQPLALGGLLTPDLASEWAASGSSSLLIGIRPESLVLAETAASADMLRLPVTVTSVESLGHEQLVYGRLPQAETPALQALDSGLTAFGATPGHVVARLPAAPLCEAGRDIRLAVDPARVHVFDADGTCRAHGLGGQAHAAAAS